MSVTVVATFYPVPEHRAELIAALEKAIPRVHAEDAGCELYSLHEGDDRLVMVEKWASLADLDAHGKGAVLKDFQQETAGFTTGPVDVQVLRPHPAGTPQQGTL
jgi:quinol monooxygenase YgiN